MDNKLNGKDAKLLVKALAQLQTDVDEMARKNKLARWANEIQTPFTLGEVLPTFAKHTLDRMRQSIGVRGISALNKEKLAGALEKAVVDNVARFLIMLDTHQYSLLKRVVESGGMTETFAINDLQVEFFRERGLLFPGKRKGKKVLAASAEIIAAFKKEDNQELRNAIQKNTEWIRLAHGLLYYYGTIPFSVLMDKIAALTKAGTVPPKRIIDVLVENALLYYGRFQIGPAGVYHREVSDPAGMAQEHRDRPNLGYFPFKYDEIWRAGDEEFVDKNMAFKRFAKFIMDNYDITRQEADDIVEECVLIIRDPEEPNHQMSEIFGFLQSQLEFDSFDTAQQFAHYLMELHNNTRQWALKGYTPNELRQAERKHLRLLPSNPSSIPGVKEGKAIGRNAPCPCGSGKKYKKCCGRGGQFDDAF